MGCDFPLKAYRSEEFLPSGKRALTFNPMRAVNSHDPMEIPCGHCIGCRLEKARQWAVRITHEAKQYDHNCFITLTYDDEAVPQDYSLDLRTLQLFMKRLRRHIEYRKGDPIRFFACGEYGDNFGRPHYHAIIFNFDFPDKKPFKTINQKPHYQSDTLTNLWGLGHALTSDVTFQSAGYVARYSMKKFTTSDAVGQNHYYRLSPIDGQYHFVKPEFAVMSRRPGLGYAYTQNFKSDYYPSGYIVVNGVKQTPPVYYLSQLSEEEREYLKRQAIQAGLVNKPHKTMERRLARAAVRDARITKLKREIK